MLSTVCRRPDYICVLLTAPTGITAYNLRAATLHSTFSIGEDVFKSLVSSLFCASSSPQALFKKMWRESCNHAGGQS